MRTLREFSDVGKLSSKGRNLLQVLKRGHWGTVCKSSKTVGQVEEKDGNLFLGEIGTETNKTFWSVDLLIINS